MDHYQEQLERIMRTEGLASRIKFMIQDVLDLRKRKCVRCPPWLREGMSSDRSFFSSLASLALLTRLSFSPATLSP